MSDKNQDNKTEEFIEKVSDEQIKNNLRTNFAQKKHHRKKREQAEAKVVELEHQLKELKKQLRKDKVEFVNW